MKKRILIAVIVLIAGVGLAACVKTPDEKVVVDKSEGFGYSKTLAGYDGEE